jgi:hypothetical protein
MHACTRTSCLRMVVVADVRLSPTRGPGSRISHAGLCSKHHGRMYSILLAIRADGRKQPHGWPMYPASPDAITAAEHLYDACSPSATT